MLFLFILIELQEDIIFSISATSHLCDTEDLGRCDGEVEGVGDKLVVPGLVSAGEVVRRAVTSSVYKSQYPKDNRTYRSP